MQVTRQDNRYLLYKESTLIGQAELDGDRITMFTVQPQWRNRGYGSYLLREMLRLNDGFARQTPSHFTAPAPENAAAAALLHKFGFSPTGEADGSWQRVRSPDMTAVELCHRFLEGTIPTGGTFLDATCGNGHDTLFLCRKASPNGRVLALDIQPAAVEATNRLLAEHGLQGVGRAIVCDHRDLGHLVPPGTLDAAVFNFGWLPGADHAVHSAAESTLPALQAAAQQVTGARVVQMRLVEEPFAAKQYDGFCLPAGTYTALRVEIGRAEGHNWFCVLYPALCVGASEAKYDRAEENALVFGKYEIRSALWDTLHPRRQNDKG